MDSYIKTLMSLRLKQADILLLLLSDCNMWDKNLPPQFLSSEFAEVAGLYPDSNIIAK